MTAASSLVTNRTKARLEESRPAFGTLSLIPEPSLPEIIGAVGYDFFVIDTEHAADDGQDLVHMIRACEAARITPIVRIRHVEEKEILWVLDSGAQGLIVPLLEDGETARRAVEFSHFPTAGSRTLCSASRAAGHGAYRQDLRPYLEHSNENLLLIGLIETPRGIENLTEILREDIDVFVVGRADLSLKLGYPYAPHHPKVIDAAKKILEAALAAGKEGGVVAYDAEDAERWMRFGCRFIIYSQPEIVLSTSYRTALETLVALDSIPQRQSIGS
jgi:2-keto-3-deoxy-L-rhamnonate aldolase RhmA